MVQETKVMKTSTSVQLALACFTLASSVAGAALPTQAGDVTTRGGRTMGPMSPAPATDTQKALQTPDMWMPRDAAPSMSLRARVTELPKSAATGSSGDRVKREVVGSSRTLDERERTIALDALTWAKTADGGHVARVRIDIEGATSVRLGYRLVGDLSPEQLRFTSEQFAQFEQGDARFVPLAAEQIRWTDVFDGSAAIIDVRLPAGANTQGKAIVIEHAVGLDIRSDLTKPNVNELVKRESDIGRGESCNSDFACVTNPSQALTDASRSVTKLLFQSGSSNVLCSATLIANQNRRNYLLTATHCIGTQAEADSLQTYWRFQADSCGSRAIPSFQRITGGSRIVWNDARIDVSLVEMNLAPPSGAILSGWSTDLARRGTVATVLHHPSGDLMKYTTGQTVGYTNLENVAAEQPLPGDKTSSFWTTQWSQGSTEGGSSGSAIITLEPPGGLCAGGCYLIRGALTQGNASCAERQGTDKFARLDLAFPYIASFLDSSRLPFTMDGTIATEYYNVTNDHYFMTADPAEANGLDQPNTRITGWYRTGEQFGVFRSGGAPVCRFFGDLAIGGPNSHFYTADAGECGFVARRGSGWALESPDAFRVSVPTNNVCPAGTQPLYRMFNYHNTPTYRNTLTGRLGFDSNHRYFTNFSYFDIMREKDTWAEEPSGRVPLMCVR
jgi:lysyl endopeptidase